MGPGGHPRGACGRMSVADDQPGIEGPVLEPWEVFRQEKEGDAMRHGGSVMAPDAELAEHYAREMYGRRQESVRLWIVRRGDTLSSIANDEYRDPGLWRPIAQANGIFNPRILEPGTQLLIPALRAGAIAGRP